MLDKDIDIHGIAHITGGGFIENIPRVLPSNINAEITLNTWPILPIFFRITNHILFFYHKHVLY